MRATQRWGVVARRAVEGPSASAAATAGRSRIRTVGLTAEFHTNYRPLAIWNQPHQWVMGASQEREHKGVDGTWGGAQQRRWYSAHTGGPIFQPRRLLNGGPATNSPQNTPTSDKPEPAKGAASKSASSSAKAPPSKVEKLLATVRARKEEESQNLNFVPLVQDLVEKQLVEKPKGLLARYPIHKAEYRRQLWVDIKDWAHHMKMGTILLWTETKIAFGLMRRLLKGGTLTRRERTQLVRTLSDLLRVVPFSLFIIIPFAELALPLALKIFPNLLPSTFRDVKTEEAKRVAELNVKLEMASFLQETVEDMAAKRKGDISDDLRSFLKLLEKGRSGSDMTPSSELLKYTQLFDDVLTIDNLDRRQLLALNRLLLLPTIGTDGLLRFQLRYRLKRLHADDLLLKSEGVNSLSVPELQAACRERGMRALGISEEGLRSRLEQWLYLNLEAEVPASLLLLSRILYLPESLDTSEQIAMTIEQMPEALKTVAKVAAVEIEGGTVSAEERLKIIAEQQEKIDAEHLAKVTKEKEVAEKAEREEREAKEREAKERDEAEKRQAAAAAAATADGNETGKSFAEEQAEGMDREKQAAAAAAGSTVTYTGPDGFKVSEVLRQPERIHDLSDPEIAQLKTAMTEVAKKDDLTTLLLRELKTEHLENVADMKALASESEGTIELPRASVILSKQVSKMLRKFEGAIPGSEEEKAAEKEVAITSDMMDLNDDGVVTTAEILSTLKNSVSKENQVNLRRLLNVIDADHDGVVKVETLQKIMDAIHEEGTEALMKLEGDAILNMVVETIEREEMARLAVERKQAADAAAAAEEQAKAEESKRKKKAKKANKKDKSDGSGTDDGSGEGEGGESEEEPVPARANAPQ